jgi:hypothetical protein
MLPLTADIYSEKFSTSDRMVYERRAVTVTTAGRTMVVGLVWRMSKGRPDLTSLVVSDASIKAALQPAKLYQGICE